MFWKNWTLFLTKPTLQKMMNLKSRVGNLYDKPVIFFDFLCYFFHLLLYSLTILYMLVIHSGNTHPSTVS